MSLPKRWIAAAAIPSSDQSQLYALRIKLGKPDDFIVLPEVISKEPLGPVVRRGDDDWFTIVKWSLFAMLNAEEMGISSKNVDEMAAKPTTPDMAHLLGAEGDFGKDLKLDNKWAYNIIKQVGNYQEVFDRNVGKDSALKIARGQNALWNRAASSTLRQCVNRFLPVGHRILRCPRVFFTEVLTCRNAQP